VNTVSLQNLTPSTFRERCWVKKNIFAVLIIFLNSELRAALLAAAA